MDNATKEIIKNLVEGSTSAYVTAIGEDGYPYTKAMFTTIREGMKVHYFSTNLSSKTAKRFMNDSHACVYFCNANQISGLAIIGDMEICQDAYHKEMLWKEGDEQYYPLGVTDPDYIVYKFTGKTCNLWYRGKKEFDIEELNSL